jgi:hypothetical protein
MDNILIRLDSKNADDVSVNEKTFTFHMKQPITLKEDYTLKLKQLQVDAFKNINFNLPIVSGFRIENLRIKSGFNSNWGNTSLGIYKYYNIFTQTILTFEVFQEYANSPRQARLIWVNANYSQNTGGSYIVYPNTTLGIGGASTIGTLLHTTLKDQFYWYKTDDFEVEAKSTTDPPSTGSVSLFTPLGGRKFKLFVNDLEIDYNEYISSSRDMKYGALIEYLEEARGVQNKTKEKYLLTLPSQVITKISITIEDENDFGLTLPPVSPVVSFAPFADNFALSFLLQKKDPKKNILSY